MLAHTDAAISESRPRKNKNAPAEMRSDRPVRRLRINADNSVKKSRDPRFSSVSGELNERIFNKTYSFLDDYREDEIKKLTHVEKKVKTVQKKEEIHRTLIK